MKTVIYCNVTTGEAFDKDGTLRTSNNPFTISYGEHRRTEWHLVSSSSPNKPVEEWTPWTDWESAPSFAYAAADDNYRSSYKGSLRNAASAGDTSLEIITDAPAEEIAPTGTLRLAGNGSSVTELEYTSFDEVSGGGVFGVEIPEGTSFPAGCGADISEEPLVSSGGMIAEESDPAHGVFSLELRGAGWRLSRKMEYADTGLLEAKGLELCVGGIDPETGSGLVLFRCRVPFAIRGVICRDFSLSAVPADLSLLQQWTLALFSAGVEVSYRSADGNWGAVSAGAEAFRWRLSGISGMPWSPEIPLERYHAGKQFRYDFSVEEADVAEVRIPLDRIDGASGPFHCGIFRISGSGATEITEGISVSFSGTEIVIGSQEGFQTGNYAVIG